MRTEPVRTAEDRSMVVPMGCIVKTGYVRVKDIRLENNSGMSLLAVEKKYHRRLCLGEEQPWPTPVGYWEDGEFFVTDGRHDVIAAILIGLQFILVAWVEVVE